MAFAVFTLFTLLAGDFWRNLMGWPAFLVMAAMTVVAWAVLLIRGRKSFRHRGFPITLVVFLAWATFSLIWSFYQGATAIALVALFGTTIVAFGLAYLMPWSRFVRALSLALRWLLGTSLLFEVLIGMIRRDPILPLWMYPFKGHLPHEFNWTNAALFTGGPIQGIMGNRNLLGFVCILGIIVFSIELADRLIWKTWGWFWIGLSAGLMILTQSMTVVFALILVAICAGFALWARRRGDGRHALVYWSAFGFVAFIALVERIFGNYISVALGRSLDFTGRSDIWFLVYRMWEKRPVFGWGWISYWAPWVKPFDRLVVRDGVTYLQAHNAVLDVAMQLGAIGALFFVVLLLTALWRAWFRAVDRPRWDLRTDRPFVAMHMLPLFILASLYAQSLMESRMLVEGGWALLVIATVATKLPDTLNEHPQLIPIDPRLT